MALGRLRKEEDAALELGASDLRLPPGSTVATEMPTLPRQS